MIREVDPTVALFASSCLSYWLSLSFHRSNPCNQEFIDALTGNLAAYVASKKKDIKGSKTPTTPNTPTNDNINHYVNLYIFTLIQTINFTNIEMIVPIIENVAVALCNFVKDVATRKSPNKFRIMDAVFCLRLLTEASKLNSQIEALLISQKMFDFMFQDDSFLYATVSLDIIRIRPPVRKPARSAKHIGLSIHPNERLPNLFEYYIEENDSLKDVGLSSSTEAGTASQVHLSCLSSICMSHIITHTMESKPGMILRYFNQMKSEKSDELDIFDMVIGGNNIDHELCKDSGSMSCLMSLLIHYDCRVREATLRNLTQLLHVNDPADTERMTSRIKFSVTFIQHLVSVVTKVSLSVRDNYDLTMEDFKKLRVGDSANDTIDGMNAIKNRYLYTPHTSVLGDALLSCIPTFLNSTYKHTILSEGTSMILALSLLVASFRVVSKSVKHASKLMKFIFEKASISLQSTKGLTESNDPRDDSNGSVWDMTLSRSLSQLLLKYLFSSIECQKTGAAKANELLISRMNDYISEDSAVKNTIFTRVSLNLTVDSIIQSLSEELKSGCERLRELSESDIAQYMSPRAALSPVSDSSMNDKISNKDSSTTERRKDSTKAAHKSHSNDEEDWAERVKKEKMKKLSQVIPDSPVDSSSKTEEVCCPSSSLYKLFETMNLSGHFINGACGKQCIIDIIMRDCVQVYDFATSLPQSGYGYLSCTFRCTD
jgi:hypothetical protein